MIPWWNYSGSGRMRTLVFRDGGALVGVLPIFVHDWNGWRQATLLGNGISDYLDLLANAGYSREYTQVA
jgi:hypothetical protein